MLSLTLAKNLTVDPYNLGWVWFKWTSTFQFPLGSSLLPFPRRVGHRKWTNPRSPTEPTWCQRAGGSSLQELQPSHHKSTHTRDYWPSKQKENMIKMTTSDSKGLAHDLDDSNDNRLYLRFEKTSRPKKPQTSWKAEKSFNKSCICQVKRK